MASKLGNWLQESRKSKGLSREAFAEILNGYGYEVKASAIAWWETEGKPPADDAELMHILSDFFKTPYIDVLRIAGFDIPYPELDEARQLILAAFDSGDLGRLVRVAIEELDKKDAHRYERLESSANDAETGTDTAGATATGRR